MLEKNWRDLIKPKALDVDKDSLTSIYGKFIAKPLERGFGLTLGNSLRRVLLSSLQGAAVTAVKFEGVLHEFSAIPDVKEDVSEIILNLKEVRFSLFSDSVQVRIEKRGQGIITAGDIISSDQVQILNPELPIATLGANGVLVLDILIKRGRGYISSEQNKDSDLAVGWISVDSFFSPIRKVNYTVTQSRVGQRTDYDKLTFEVWTDGSVLPEEAIALGSKILKDQLSVFLNFEEEPEPLVSMTEEGVLSFNQNLYRSVEELELSVRSANCLQNANIRYIYELVQKTESDMLKTKNFGRKSLTEIKDILGDMGLTLGMKLEGFVPPADLGSKEKVLSDFDASKDEELSDYRIKDNDLDHFEDDEDGEDADADDDLDSEDDDTDAAEFNAENDPKDDKYKE